jgi:hypothetical protein
MLENMLKTYTKNKYGNTKVVYQGLKFDSRLELTRWQFLQDCESKGLISDLQRQVRCPLIAGDILICHYVADFEYKRNGEVITEDAKGFLTDIFKIKAKLFEVFYLRKIRIVKKENVTSL